MCRAAFFGSTNPARAAECGLTELLAAVEQTVRGCPCENGCPSCVHSPKSADGLLALQWWKEGRVDDIAAYCRKDVELTRDLYRYGCSRGYVLFSNKAGQNVRLPVDWATFPA